MPNARTALAAEEEVVGKMLTGRIKNGKHKKSYRVTGKAELNEILMGHSSRGTWVDRAPNLQGKLVLY